MRRCTVVLFRHCFSAPISYEVKNNCCLFERLFKVKRNDVFRFGISFSVTEIFTFLCYANEESDDVIGGATQSRISLEIFEKCSLNLAPETFITKETK